METPKLQAPDKPPHVKRSRLQDAARDFLVYVLGGLTLGLVLGALRWGAGEIGLAGKVTGDVAGWFGSLAGQVTRIGLFIFLAKRIVSAFR